MQKRGRWVAVVLMAVAVASAACNGGSGSKTPVAAITQKFAASTFQATYDVTGTGADPGGTMVLYKDGPTRFRFDITASQAGQPLSVVFIQNDTTSAFCLKDAAGLGPILGIPAGQGVCFKSNPNDPNNPVGNLSSTFADIENADVTVLSTSTKTVAGRDTSCYRARDNTTSDISTICFASDGAMLYVQTEGANASTIEATDVTSSVASTNFDLPYQVKDFPSALRDGQ